MAAAAVQVDGDTSGFLARDSRSHWLIPLAEEGLGPDSAEAVASRGSPALAVSWRALCVLGARTAGVTFTALRVPAPGLPCESLDPACLTCGSPPPLPRSAPYPSSLLPASPPKTQCCSLCCSRALSLGPVLFLHSLGVHPSLSPGWEGVA